MAYWFVAVAVIAFAAGVTLGTIIKAEAYAIYEAIGKLEQEDAAKVMAILHKVSSKL